MTNSRWRVVPAICALMLTTAACSVLPGGGDRDLHISADFENVAGMYPGNEVAVLGVPVGTVDTITPKGDYVQVTMTIDRDIPVPADAIAALVSPQLITNRHVELTPAYTGGPALADGQHIPLQRTRIPVELDRVLDTVDELSAALRGDSETGPLATRVLFPVLDGNGDRLRATLDALAGAFEVTTANSDQISNAIVKLTEITQLVAENDQTVRDFSGRLTEVMQLLSEQAPGLHAVLAQLNDFIANTSTVVDENRDQLTGSLQRFAAIAAQMRANARGLTEVVDVSPLFFQNFSKAMDRERGFVRLHALLDKSLLDSEALSTFCERVQLRSDGCRTGRVQDFGPDFGLTMALLGLTK